MIELMVKNKRLGQLDEVAREFEDYYKAKDRRETVRVVSAEKLDKK
jgi:F0F1-type ATP synthase delta subunit